MTFRATGITDYLNERARIEVAQRIAGHPNATMAEHPGAWHNENISPYSVICSSVILLRLLKETKMLLAI